MSRNGRSLENTPRFKTVDEAMRFYTERRSAADKGTLLKEYELLRAEINGSQAAQLQIISFGTATLGLVSGAAFIGSEAAFRSDVLIVFLPLLAYLTLTIWFAEVMRMFRAGSFLLVLEKRLDEAQDGSLDWEATVWRGRVKVDPSGQAQRRRIRTYYSLFDPDQLRLFAVALLFLTIAGSSIAMGWAGATVGQRWFALGAGALALVVIVLLYHLRLNQIALILDVQERPRFTRAIARIANAPEREAPGGTEGAAAPNP
jgi:hypothetical protein